MKAKDAIELLNEDGGTTAGIASFQGRSGVGIDGVFAGGFHPEYGQIGSLLQNQLSYRKWLRGEMIKAIGEENLGDDLPLGGFYDFETDILLNSYDELEKIAKDKIDYSIENTPESETDWENVDINYRYDKIVDSLDDDKWKNKTNKMKSIDVPSYTDIVDKLDNDKWKNKTNKMKFIDIYNMKVEK